MSTTKAPCILIVDDHEDNVVLLRMMLTSQGYRILTASDGARALDLVRSEIPDLLLLDVMMPRMSGYEVVQAIRGDASIPYIPVMLITAKQDMSDKVHGLEAGADDFLTKPVQTAELNAKVRALLRLKRVQDELISERNKNELLYLIGKQLSSTLDVDQLIATTLDLMSNLVGAVQASAIVRDLRRDAWRIIMPNSSPSIEHDLVAADVMQHGLAGIALTTCQPQIILDTHDDHRWLYVDSDPTMVRSALAIPLIRDAADMGVLTLTHTEPGYFQPDQIPLLQAVAAQVATALQNASLYTQLKQAEAAREYFVHMLTHDLRGPLAGILGCLHVLSISEHDETNTEFIGLAQRAAEAQEQLINDILDVYRADAGQLVLETSVLVPGDLTTSIYDQMIGAAVERNLTLDIDLPQQPTIVADVRKLTRVLINLVSNAIKFTRAGGVWVSAEMLSDESAVRFEVRDTGIGIAPEHVPYVFERFYRVPETGARSSSGLGLNFCREVVRAHGGTIWAESYVDTGTTMFFTIPTGKAA